MADDCLVGFKFVEKDDLINDALVKDAAETMFSEVVVDAGFDHLGSGSDTKDSRGVEQFDEFANFDFTEGFDFAF